MATLPQSITAGVLTDLKFEHVPDDSGRCGGDQEMKPTPESVSLLNSMVNEGKTVIVKGDGSVTF